MNPAKVLQGLVGIRLTYKRRLRIEALIEPAIEASDHDTAGALIELLDAADGDPDFEPSLGAPELADIPPIAGYERRDILRWRTPADDREPDGDELEPDIGWTEARSAGEGRAC